MERLQKLNQQHKAAARLKVEGKTIAVIAEDLGVSIHTLHVWFSDERMKAEVARLLERVDEMFIEKMATSGLRAMGALSDFAEHDAATRYFTCQRCNWTGRDETRPHGSPDDPCDGPYDMRIGISETAKLDSLREVLDRVERTAKIRDKAEAQAASGGNGDTNYLQIFQNMPDEKLAELMGLWANSNGHNPALPESNSG